uniref:Uncharacterized protein n=1 Tax=Arundo donax TaxID=35708 RepID=A0A0A9BXF1_ARUDO
MVLNDLSIKLYELESCGKDSCQRFRCINSASLLMAM